MPTGRSVYYVGDHREAVLQRYDLAVAIGSLIPGFERARYPDWASLLERWHAQAPPGAVLALDEFPFLVRASPELPSVLQKALDAGVEPAPHVVVCGSSQRMMQGLLLDATAPLYGRAQEILEVAPLGAGWIGEALGLPDPLDAVQAFAVWGGVPRYWELAADHPTLWEAVRELVLDPMGVLHQEPERILQDDARDWAQAASVLTLIGRGCHRLSEVAGRLGKPATSLTRPLARLQDLHLVAREVPFGTPPRTSGRSLYRIADPYLAFWFRFVESHRSLLGAGQIDTVAERVRQGFDSHLGQVWECLVRESVPRSRFGGRTWGPASRWWGTGTDGRPLELDVVAESTDGTALLVGEAKVSLRGPGGSEGLRRLQAAAERLPLAARHAEVVTRVFAAAGPARGDEHVVTAETVLQALR
ncbi:MAG: ATP-binding protein [Candidatus Riflebacteria bacterium]|nr:ATP-binding protein [Candidatus Riflebacteria bacterium]